MKLSTKVLIGFLILWFAFYCSPADVNAAENTNHTTLIKRHNVNYYGQVREVVEYHLYSNSELIGYRESSGQTAFTTVNSLLGISDQVTYDTFADGEPITSNAVASVPIRFDQSYGSLQLELFCKYFDSYDSAMAYCNNGNIDGLVNLDPNNKTEANNGFYSYDFKVNYYDTHHGRNEYYYFTYTSPYELIFFIDTENNFLYMTSPVLENGIGTGMEIRRDYALNDGPTGEEQTGIEYKTTSGAMMAWNGPVVSNDVMQNLTYSVTGKLFDNYENAKAYCQTGSLSGLLNTPTFSDDLIDSTVNLGYLQNVEYHKETDTSSFPYKIYTKISWDNTMIKFDGSIIQIRNTGGFGMGNNLTGYDFDLLSISDNYSYSKGQVYIDDEYWKKGIEENTGKNIGLLDTIKNNIYYIRAIRFNADTGKYEVGGWTRISEIKTAQNNITTGTLDSNGNFTEDLTSDDNYSYGMDLDGSYDNKSDYSTPEGFEGSGFDWFLNTMNSLRNNIGTVPDFFAELFAFMPTSVTVALSALIIGCVILRFLGR